MNNDLFHFLLNYGFVVIKSYITYGLNYINLTLFNALTEHFESFFNVKSYGLITLPVDLIK